MDAPVLTVHAIDRYHERVKPGLSRVDAKADLERMLDLAEVVDVRPCWAGEGHQADRWLTLGEGIAFPLVDNAGTTYAVTCLCNAGLSEQGRERRQRRKRARRERANLRAERSRRLRLERERLKRERDTRAA